MLTLLVVTVTFLQFFLVSRNYLTSDYTEERTRKLKKEAQQLDQGPFAQLPREARGEMESLLDGFEQEHQAPCFILDSYFHVIAASRGMDRLPGYTVPAVRRLFETGKIYDFMDRQFRIPGYFHLPSRYVGIVDVILPRDRSENTPGVAYFVAVTPEIYTWENYRMFLGYGAGLVLLSACFCLFFALVLARVIARPVLRLQENARKMSRLDFSIHCSESRQDELGELGQDLNSLARQLRSTILQLETANRKLQQDLDLQQEVDRMRKGFIAAASHEFKTPLTLLRGYLEMLQENRLPEGAQQKACQVMVEEIDSLDHLVLELLDLTVTQENKREGEAGPFFLEPLFFQCRDEFAPLLARTGIHLELAGAEGRSVRGCRSSIHHVLVNFLSNAVKHTSQGGTIRLEAVDQDSDTVEIRVANTGEPIPEGEWEKVWMPFYRVNKKKERQQGGSGLGLAICREILQQENSRFGVRNGEQGPEFFFSLKKVPAVL